MDGPNARLNGQAASGYNTNRAVTGKNPAGEEPGLKELQEEWKKIKDFEVERARRIRMGIASAASCCVNAAKGLVTASCSSLGAIKPQTVPKALSVVIGGGLLGGVMPGDSADSAATRRTLVGSVLEASSIATAGVAVLCAGFCAWDHYRRFPDGESAAESALTTNGTHDDEAELHAQTSTSLRESRE